MPEPKNTADVKRFLGMVNYIGKFSPNIAELTGPIRDLLKAENDWAWGSPQQQAFEKVKQELSSSAVLAQYCPERQTRVSADASFWTRRSTVSAPAYRGMETGRFHLKKFDTCREKVCTNWEGGTSNHLGLWKIPNLPSWTGFRGQDWSQAPSKSTRLETARWPASTHTKISSTSSAVLLQNYACCWKKLDHSRHTF